MRSYTPPSQSCPSPCRAVVLRGALALLAGLALGVDAWGNFHWDNGDVMRGVIAAAPLGVLCESKCAESVIATRANATA